MNKLKKWSNRKCCVIADIVIRNLDVVAFLIWITATIGFSWLVYKVCTVAISYETSFGTFGSVMMVLCTVEDRLKALHRLVAAVLNHNKALLLKAQTDVILRNSLTRILKKPVDSD